MDTRAHPTIRVCGDCHSAPTPRRSNPPLSIKPEKSGRNCAFNRSQSFHSDSTEFHVFRLVALHPGPCVVVFLLFVSVSMSWGASLLYTNLYMIFLPLGFNFGSKWRGLGSVSPKCSGCAREPIPPNVMDGVFHHQQPQR